MKPSPAPAPSSRTVACVLAGGHSTRMGRDKARLRLGSKTLLAWVRAAAREAGLPVRVIRRDRVPRCGPLGGVLTALERGRKGGTMLFLSCDMPFLSAGWLNRIEKASKRGARAVFTELDGLAGFPFALPAESLSAIRRQVELGKFSLQSLARGLDAVSLHPGRQDRLRFLNVNTPEDMQHARGLLAKAEAPNRTYSSKVRTLRRPRR